MLSAAGICSRRHAEDLIREGRVTVNGAVAQLGQKASPDDEIRLDGAPVLARQEKVCYLLNKPPGVVTTLSDPQGRPSVAVFTDALPERVYPIGRLDRDSEGMLLLTNDGDLANLLAHPSHGVPKEYLAEVAGAPSPGAVRALRQGVQLDDGPTAPAVVGTVAPGVLRITIHEGRNRQVRRMCAAVGHPVRRLVRTRIGPVADPSLRPGRWRPLTVAEVQSLFRVASVGDPDRSRRRRAAAAGPARAGPRSQGTRRRRPRTHRRLLRSARARCRSPARAASRRSSCRSSAIGQP